MVYGVIVYAFNGVKISEDILLNYFKKFYREEIINNGYESDTDEYILNKGLEKCFNERFKQQLLLCNRIHKPNAYYVVVEKPIIVYEFNSPFDLPNLEYESDISALPKVKLSDEFHIHKIMEELEIKSYKISPFVSCNEYM